MFFGLYPIDGEVISWSAEKKLEWTDFKGAPQQNTSAAAMVASGITFSFSVKESSDRGYVSFDTNVEAHFYPNKSWYIKERANDYILAHEQLHFDLTELYVRKLRSQISKLKISPNIKKELNALHDKINIELAKEQYRYDDETNHSLIVEKQAEWSDFIKSELSKYVDYASK